MEIFLSLVLIILCVLRFIFTGSIFVFMYVDDIIISSDILLIYLLQLLDLSHASPSRTSTLFVIFWALKYSSHLRASSFVNINIILDILKDFVLTNTRPCPSPEKHVKLHNYVYLMALLYQTQINIFVSLVNYYILYHNYSYGLCTFDKLFQSIHATSKNFSYGCFF